GPETASATATATATVFATVTETETGTESASESGNAAGGRRSGPSDREQSPQRPVPKPQLSKRPELTEEDFKGKSPEEIEMMKVMGFGGFDTTKGKKVDGNNQGAVHVVLKRRYRQYMNRKGGFNRPLDFVL
ncbi:U4/U6.U5 small nuclear ribonucleoprotein 27 kDa protein-like, partial [Pollicipes pollicipes]|uniref:U4/U6.U5 small nuclear ribonucleoprotein 27 kDa protein-like n=1 Tax=Pollicipes pollicipes TaxID=41117 RepID=UPI0018857CCA